MLEVTVYIACCCDFFEVMNIASGIVVIKI